MARFTIFAIVLLFLLISNVYAQANVLQTVYQIKTVIFKDDNTQLTEIDVMNSTISVFPSSDTGYSIKVFSNDGKVLFKEFLGVSFNLNLEPMGTIHLNKTTITIKVPFYTNVKSIAIYHSSKKILDIDLSEHFCNKNSICDLGENQYICPEDCITEPEGFPWIYVGISAACVVILVTIFFLKRSRPKNEEWKSVKKWQ